MSSTYADAGERSPDLRIHVPTRVPTSAADAVRGARPRPVVEAKPKRRKGRPRLAQALTLSLGVTTLLLGGLFVTVASFGAGSVRPADWGKLNWNLLAERFDGCVKSEGGLGAVSCLKAIGPGGSHPTAPLQRGLVYVTTTVPMATPVPAPTHSAPAARPPGAEPPAAVERPAGQGGGGQAPVSRSFARPVQPPCQAACPTARPSASPEPEGPDPVGR